MPRVDITRMRRTSVQEDRDAAWHRESFSGIWGWGGQLEEASLGKRPGQMIDLCICVTQGNPSKRKGQVRGRKRG